MEVLYLEDDTHIRLIIILGIGTLLLFFWIQREMNELRLISFTSTVWAIAFCVLLWVYYLFDMTENTRPLSKFTHPNYPISNYLRTAPNILLAYCFQPSFFSVYKSLHDKTDKNAWTITYHSYLLSTLIYVVVAILSILLFGEHIQSDLLLNITENVDSHLRHLWSILFLIIAALHLPVIFFVGKESLLMIYCEARYNTLSLDRYHTSVSEDGESEINFTRFVKNNINISTTLDWKEYYPITLILYFGVIAWAIYITDLGKIFGILGSFWATFLALILPPAFFLKLQDGNAMIRTIVFSFIVLIFGITFWVVGLYSNILL